MRGSWSPPASRPRDPRAAPSTRRSSAVLALIGVVLGVEMRHRRRRRLRRRRLLLGGLVLATWRAGACTCSAAGQPVPAPHGPLLPRRSGSSTSPALFAGRVRRDRLLDLLRARHRRPARARVHTPGSCSCVGAALPRRRALVRRGHRGDPGDRRRRDVRARAFNDSLGFLTGWALFLDYLIVIALAALFVPHYLGGAIGWHGIAQRPWDVDRRRAGSSPRSARRAARCGVRASTGWRASIAVARPRRRTSSSSCSASSSSSRPAPPRGPRPGDGALVEPSRSRCRSRCSRTRGSRRSRTSPPRRAQPGSRPAAEPLRRDRAVVVVSSRSRSSASRPIPAPAGTTDSATSWHARAARSASSSRSTGTCRRARATSCGLPRHRPARSSSLAAVTTSISGFGRLAYSLGEHGMLPHAFGAAPAARSSRRAVDQHRRHRRPRSSSPPRRRERGAFAREPLQLRRAARVHGGAGGGDPPALHQPDLDRPFRVAAGTSASAACGCRVAALVGAPLTSRSG